MTTDTSPSAPNGPTDFDMEMWHNTAPDTFVGHLDTVSGKMTWVAHECPLCMKAILDEEWQEHQAWHAGEPA